jgi:DNA-directed RNA polymerase specialized sigma subunit
MAIQSNMKEELTQQQVADALGLSRVAVYQIEKRAFQKIRRALFKMKIDGRELIPN